MRTLLALTLTFAASAASLAADNWPQFRGPNGTGHSGSTGLPVTWSETQNIVWKTPIHDRGWSSPVVWGNQVWLTTARPDGKELFAVCVDRTTGKIVHDLKVFDVAKPEPLGNPINNYAAPTPAIEEGRVYVHFGTYGTACLDTATGRKVWERRDLHCNHWRGPGSSPILFEDLLILQFDGFDKQFITALNKKTGETVWLKDREINYGTTNGDVMKAYATPSLIVVAGRPQLVSPAATATTAYDPRTGDQLWRVYHGGMNVSQPPQYFDGRVILCTSDGGLKLLAVRTDGSGDVTKTHIEWKYGKSGVPNRSSPLLVDDHLVMLKEDGILTSLNARTGEMEWQERVFRGGQCITSPVYGDGKLYLFNDEGKAVVGKPGRTWTELAVNQLDDGGLASPAIAGKALFVRTRTHLYRIEQK